MTWTPFPSSASASHSHAWSPFGVHVHESAQPSWVTPGGQVQGAWVKGGMPTPTPGGGAMQTGGTWVQGGLPSPESAASSVQAMSVSGSAAQANPMGEIDGWLLGAHNTGQVDPSAEAGVMDAPSTGGEGPAMGAPSTGGSTTTAAPTTEAGCTTPNLWDPDLGQCLTWDEQMERIKLQNECTRLGQLFDKTTKSCVAQDGVAQPSGPCPAPNRVWIATGECIDPAEQERRAKLNFDCGDRGGVFDATNLSCRMAGEGDDASGGGESGTGEGEKKSILPWVVGLAAVGAAVAVGLYVMNQPAAGAAATSEV